MGKSLKKVMAVLVVLTVAIAAGVMSMQASASETGVYTIQKDATYSFENIGTVSKNITGLNGRLDYVVYYKDGSVSGYELNRWNLTTLSVPAGGKAVITSVEYTINATVEDDYFIVEEQANPVFRKAAMELYETYTYTNTSNVAYKILGGDSYYDYVLYDADGNVSSYVRSTSAGSVEVPAGYSIKLTTTNGPRVFAGLYDAFTLKKENNPVMRRTAITEGETYTYTNISNVAYKILGGDSYYDYVLYDADGNVSSYVRSSSAGSVEVPAGYSMKITVTSGYRDFLGLHEMFTVKKESEPVMRRVVITDGETYTFTNISTASHKIMGGDSYYDYALYDSNGNLTNYAGASSSGNVEVPAGYSLKITVTSGYRDFLGLYEAFTVKKESEPVMRRVVATEGETYTFTNTSSVPRNVMGGNSYYDYVLYYANGSIKETVKRTSKGSIEVPAGGRVEITPTSGSRRFYALYEAFDVEYTGVLPTYKVVNTDTVDCTLVMINGNVVDYVIYDADNNLAEYGVSLYEVTIPRGGYAIVTASAKADAAFEENDYLDITEFDEPVYNVTRVKPYETYKYTNDANREMRVYKSYLTSDYVVHNADGSIEEYNVDSWDGYINVPIGGSVTITAFDYLTIKGLNSYFDVEKVEKSVFDTIACEYGKTYQFVNDAVKDITLFIKSGVYDYVIYNADDSVYTGAANYYQERLTVPTGSKLVITPLTKTLSVSCLNEAFVSVSTRSFPVMARFNAYFGSSPVVITNKAQNGRNLLAVANYIIDYATYNQYGNVEEAKEEVSPNSITVSPGGSAEITARQSTAVFAGLYEAFTDEDLSVPVTGVQISKTSLTLDVGKQTVLSATVLPADATNKSVTWSSDNPSVVTVAQTGKVTAKSEGKATITVTTVDGGYTAKCTVTVGSEPIDPDVVTGDANGDGDVDFVDALLVLKHDAGLESLSGDALAAADTDANSEVDFVDALLILKFDAGLITSFK